MHAPQLERPWPGLRRPPGAAATPAGQAGGRAGPPASPTPVLRSSKEASAAPAASSCASGCAARGPSWLSESCSALRRWTPSAAASAATPCGGGEGGKGRAGGWGWRRGALRRISATQQQGQLQGAQAAQGRCSGRGLLQAAPTLWPRPHCCRSSCCRPAQAPARLAAPAAVCPSVSCRRRLQSGPVRYWSTHMLSCSSWCWPVLTAAAVAAVAAAAPHPRRQGRCCLG
jgi:hypothetical protein